ncbi:MAG: hypothetical protein R3C59_15660 [Planctomycetaceae bacterium]
MNHRSQDSWRKGKKPSPREAAREVAATPSWKRSKTRTGASTGGRRRNWRILIPIVLLALLVVAGVWIFSFGDKVHTHVVVLDLLSSAEYFDPIPAPKFPQIESRRTGESTVEHIDSLKFDAATPEDNRSRAQAVIVHLQTQIVAGANGQLLCLFKNSTPDLSSPSQSEPLETLRESLKALIAGPRDKGVLLIVDCSHSIQDARLGHLAADINQELSTWPTLDGMERLVVMTSCASGETSQPAPVGSGGQTAFGHIVARGLSQAANTETGTPLTVAEFCRFVQQQTAQWVRNHRGGPGQTVQVWPTPDTLHDEQRNFVLMTEIPPDPGGPTFQNPGTIVDQMVAAWKTREQLSQKQAWRWSPLAWQSATEYLLRCQSALLDGNTSRAAELLNDNAHPKLRTLKTATDAVVSDSAHLNSDFGLPHSWTATFPNAARLNDLWSGVETPPEVRLPSIENVLRTNADAANYQWQVLGLPVPDNAIMEQFTSQRTLAERAAAAVLGVTKSLRQTILKAEQQLLTSEDLLFTKPMSNSPPVDRQAMAAQWDAVQRFAEVHQQAECRFQQALTSTESLARWAARFPFADSDSVTADWDQLLLQNLPGRPVTARTARELMQKADVAGIGQPALVQLRSDVFRLLVASRMLATLLHPDEPQDGFDATTLNAMADDLQTWYDLTTQAITAVNNRMEAASTSLQQLPETREEQTARWQEIRETLDITSLPVNLRGDLLRSLLKLEEQLSENTGLMEPSTATTASGPATVTPRRVALWHVQHLALLVPQQQIPATLTTAADAARSLSKTGDDAAGDQRRTAEFGSAIREFWQVSTSDSKTALNAADENAIHKLQIADRRSRGMAAYDELNPEPTSRLHAWQQVDYCLLHAQRLLQNQWILPGEAAPLQDNGWYARYVRLWLQPVTEIAERHSAGFGAIPDFIGKAMDACETSLKKSATWNVTVTSQNNSIHIGEQNSPTENVAVTIAAQGSVPAGAIGALRFLPDRDSPSSSLVNIPANAQPLSLNSAESASIEFRRSSSPAADHCESVRYMPEMFFRGREWRARQLLTVNPCRSAEFVVTRIARPATGSVLVGGNDRRPIVFVLDMSLSMEQNRLANGRTRASVALDTMEEIIRRETRDRNDSAFLKVFGHRSKAVRTPDGGFDIQPNENYRSEFPGSPPPNGIDPNADIRTEVGRTPLDARGKKKFIDVLKRLRRSGPFGITPLVGAIKEALLVDLNSRPGIIVAITDGEATDTALIPDLQKAREQNPGSRIIVVAFDFANNNAGRRNLGTMLEQLTDVTIVDARDQAELDRTIEEALEPRSWQISGDSGRIDKTQKFEQTLTELPVADDYTVTFDKISTTSPMPVGPGDLIQLNVDWDTSAFHFDRPRSALEFVEAPAPDRQPTTPHKLRLIDAANVQGKASIGLMLDHDSQTNPVRQPAEIEFRITSAENFRPPAVQEEYTSEWHAPGYRLTIDDWPLDQKVRIDAFWKPQRTEPEQIVAYPDLPQTTNISAGRLPAATLSSTLRDTGILEVRLTPQTPTPDPDYSGNTVQNIRIEIGSTGELTGNDRFVPDEVLTRITRTETGSVVYEFLGDYTAELLADRKIAFTSKAAREASAIRPGVLVVP